MQEQMICRHCLRLPVNRPRGLCWGCYYLPGVRFLYPSTHWAAYRGSGNHNLTSTLPDPDEPTDALPGTPAKIETMIQRAAAGRALYHPADAKGGTGEDGVAYLPGIRQVRYHGEAVQDD